MKINDFRHFFVQNPSGKPPENPRKTPGISGGNFPGFFWDPLCKRVYPGEKFGENPGENPGEISPKSRNSRKFREILVKKGPFLAILTHF